MQPAANPSWLTRLTDAFAYPLRTSHYLELVNPLWTTHALQAKVVGVWDETADARTITLKPGRNWRSHRPGQHLRVGVPIGGMHYTRTYSISSAPDCGVGDTPETFTITVKAIQGGRMSHHLVRNIKVGDYLPIGIPQGDFYLPDANPVEPLFITAGSGITPIMSMLRSLVAQERLPHVTHLHYAPHAYDVIFGQELQALAAKHPRYQLHLIGRDPDRALPGLEDARHLGLRAAGPARCSRSALAAGRRFAPAARRAFPRTGGSGTEGSHRRHRALHREQGHGGKRRRRQPAALSRGQRAEPTARLPDGHLPRLRRHTQIWLRARPAHECPTQRTRRHRADLRLRGGRRRRTRSLIFQGERTWVCPHT